MEVRNIVVLVEDLEVARTALNWALQNLIRHGDLITLLHVFPSTRSRSKKKLRFCRLKGFQLALSFKDICDRIPDAKVEIVVTEGDQEGRTIVSTVRKVGAWALVVGLHDHSFLYKMAMAHDSVTGILNCRVLAIRDPSRTRSTAQISWGSLDFSQIEIDNLCIPHVPSQKVPYQLCPSPSRIMWRGSRRSKKSGAT